MKCFKYKILKGSELVLMNYINSNSKEEALASLEEVKVAYDGTDIKLTEVSSSNRSC